MDRFLKFVPLASLMTIIGIGIGIVNWVIQDAQSRKEQQMTIEATTFDDGDQKKDHEDHVNTAPNDVETYLMFKKLDSVIKDKNVKDQWRDSMIMKMAITQYQTKKIADSSLTEWKEYNKTKE